MSLRLNDEGRIPEEVHIDDHEWIGEKKKMEAKWIARKENAITTAITAGVIAVMFWVSGLILDDIKRVDSEQVKTNTNR